MLTGYIHNNYFNFFFICWILIIYFNFACNVSFKGLWRWWANVLTKRLTRKVVSRNETKCLFQNLYFLFSNFPPFFQYVLKPTLFSAEKMIIRTRLLTITDLVVHNGSIKIWELTWKLTYYNSIGYFNPTTR